MGTSELTVTLVYRRKLHLKAKFERNPFCQCQALSSRCFQLGLDMVNLHRPTLVLSWLTFTTSPSAPARPPTLMRSARNVSNDAISMILSSTGCSGGARRWPYKSQHRKSEEVQQGTHSHTQSFLHAPTLRLTHPQSPSPRPKHKVAHPVARAHTGLPIPRPRER
jgi:hypothetical protein